MSLLFKGRQNSNDKQKKSAIAGGYFFVINIFRQGVHSLGEMWRTPLASLMTIAVLGLSLTLPATLYLVVKNVQQVSSGFEEASEISLFVKESMSEQETQTLVKRLALYAEVESVEFISKQQALTEFKDVSGFGQALEYLDSNPLPDVVLVTPTKRHRQPNAAKALLTKLENEREVDFGKLDIAWLERLNALLDLLKESVITIALLLLTSVTLIIGNTIRLSIMDKKEEIQVMKLVGATNTFIHAPFLWTGIWYGVIGGLFAFICIALMMWWLTSAVSSVAGVYQTSFSLIGLTLNEFGALVLLATSLGFIGSYLSVNRYIKEIEPDKV
ncbi:MULTISPECIES: permease-like cell division protein FtsX [unclassified Pseudoalteromonas]|uniref:permease-like cell division protein FtsX n=1 Tax=unclassified Pseudoalteromonas TaxID=194690 RepID=UPI002359CEAE|nr:MULTISPECIES: permease-like cell division protein FtsX [unclassified Pseudoalteromonas]MDC9564992.1 permease-like cell division protein FtsX [Pseudoalteromonas sp. GAB2316C]MDC9569360.1 permease-like cell division protein FtsX [Pseudoalteromonas sp. GABNB9D]MDC9573408.1 permease-like cell division protein FtsX [Pseudoalteromonas sp. GABNS16A]MDC9577797.1 permease-like cell division protein FtsX [Pseudoalteromonas sp. GABNS16E]MDC9585450.1 permease-like cell division protein FtsX [Pseudoalte